MKTIRCTRHIAEEHPQECPRCSALMVPARGHEFPDEFYYCGNCEWTLGIDQCSPPGFNAAVAEHDRKRP